MDSTTHVNGSNHPNYHTIIPSQHAINDESDFTPGSDGGNTSNSTLSDNQHLPDGQPNSEHNGSCMDRAINTGVSNGDTGRHVKPRLHRNVTNSKHPPGGPLHRANNRI